jgi:peptidoglycan/LPS O-acetylase OafA/YrhL
VSGTEVSAPARRTLLAYRAAAVLYGGATVWGLGVFAGALGDRTIRSGVLFYAFFTGAAALGLWLATRWGRAMALVVALGNAGVGTLSLLASILDGSSAPVGWGSFTAANVALAYLLSRSVFALPADD